MASRVQSRIKGVMLVLVALVLVAYVLLEWVFNIGSNLVLYAVQGSVQELQVKTREREWKRLGELSAVELQNALRERYKGDGLSWKRLSVRRANGRFAWLLQWLFGAEVNVLVLDPGRYEFASSFQEGFAVTTARERLQAEGALFAINANFRDPDNKPLGWVWHEGRQVNRPFPEWSGVFFVKEGRPWFGPKSLLEEVPGVMTEGVQVYPSVIKNHQVFNYVTDQPDRFFDGKKITYRSLAGVRQSGEVVFVLSGDGGVMNVSEVAGIAQRLAVQHGTLLDGGKALQYSVMTEDGGRHFEAFNTRFDFPVKRAYLERQRSPVYIVARRPLPPIVSP